MALLIQKQENGRTDLITPHGEIVGAIYYGNPDFNLVMNKFSYNFESFEKAVNFANENYVFCLAIQCKDEKSGKTGSFVFSPNKPGLAASPVFSSLIGLFTWLSDNGYSECKGPSILGNYEKVNKC